MDPVPVKDRTISAARTAASGEIIRDAQVLKPADFNQIKAPAGTIAEVAITWTPGNSIPQPHIVAFEGAQADGLSMDFEAGTYTFTLQGIAQTERKTLKPEEVATHIVTVPADEAGGQEQTPSEPENPGTGDGGEQGQSPSEPETPGTGEDGDDTGEGTDITLPESDPVAAAELFGTWADEEYGSTFTFNVDYTGSKGDAHESYFEWAVPEKGRLELIWHNVISSEFQEEATYPVSREEQSISFFLLNDVAFTLEGGDINTFKGTWTGEYTDDVNGTYDTYEIRLIIHDDYSFALDPMWGTDSLDKEIGYGRIENTSSDGFSLILEEETQRIIMPYTLSEGDSTLTLDITGDGTFSQSFTKQPQT